MRQAFTCQVITSSSAVLRCQASSVRFPSHDGSMGILANHAPLVAMVGHGSFVASTAEGRTYFLQMEGGFAEVRDNVLTILPERTSRLLERSAESQERILQQARRDLEAELEGAG